MSVIQRIPPLNEWSKAARIVDQAGRNLKLRLGEEVLSAKDIQREIVKLGEYTSGSILPADYCYNRINRAPYSCRFPVFEWLGQGKYRYLGPNYDYTGPIIWKPRGESERPVGEWKSGVCCLREDPRQGP